MGEEKQSIKTEPEIAQMLDLADKGYKIALMCYRNKRCSKNFKKRIILMSEQNISAEKWKLYKTTYKF